MSPLLLGIIRIESSERAILPQESLIPSPECVEQREDGHTEMLVLGQRLLGPLTAQWLPYLGSTRRVKFMPQINDTFIHVSELQLLTEVWKLNVLGLPNTERIALSFLSLEGRSCA